MAERLKNTLTFANLAPGATTVLAHGLQTSRPRPLAPDIVYIPSPDLEVTASDTTNVTIRNAGSIPLSGALLVEAWHTIERAFSDVNDEDLPVKPYIVVSVEGNGQPPQPPFPVPQIVITIYARMTGNDTTGIGTLANPYLTMQRAVRDVPTNIPPGVRYVVDITGITGVLPTDYVFPAWKSPVTPIEFDPFSPYFLYVGGVSIEAEPRFVAAIPLADATVAPTDRLALTSVTGSDFLLITLDPIGPNPVRASWAGNALKGKLLIAANALENATIVASTSTTILVEQTAVPGLTGTFRIMEPSATFTVSSSATNFIVQGGLAARNVDSIAIGGIKVIDSTPTLSAFGLEVSGNGAAAVQLCEVQELLVLIGSVDSCRLNRLWVTGRARLAGSWSLQSVLFDNCNPLPFTALGPTVGNFRRVAFVGGTTVRMCASAFSGQNAVVGGPAALFIAENILIADVTLPAGAADGFRFHGLRGLLRNADIRNNGRDGVRCDEGVGYLELLNVRSTTPNGVITATGVGVRTLNGNWSVRVDAATSGAAAGTQLRGAGGEMQIGTLPVRTWANFVGFDPKKNQFDLTTPFELNVASGLSTPAGETTTGVGTGGRSGNRLYQI